MHRALKESGEPLPPQRVVHIASQISRGMQAAHDLGIIHRDLKPGNVMLVDVDGDPDTVKILDFGVVKATQQQDDTVEKLSAPKPPSFTAEAPLSGGFAKPSLLTEPTVMDDVDESIVDEASRPSCFAAANSATLDRVRPARIRVRPPTRSASRPTTSALSALSGPIAPPFRSARGTGGVRRRESAP